MLEREKGNEKGRQALRHSFPEALASGLLVGEQWRLKQQPGSLLRPRTVASERSTTALEQQRPAGRAG